MDDAIEASRKTGGTIEPVKQVLGANVRPKLATQDPPGREYEMYDPFRNVMHRAKTFDGMVAKADEMHFVRFNAVEADGTRTPVEKVDGKWQVPAPQPMLPFPDPETAVNVRRNLARAAQRPDAMLDRAEPAAARAASPAAAGPVDPADLREEAERRRAVEVARIQVSLHERYVVRRAMLHVGELQVGQTEYRFRGDHTRVAFTESNARLATDTNSPSVARSMVDVAQARNWKGLRVSGNEDFKRLVWIEATVRGVKTVGYEPAPVDMDLLRKERDSRLVNRVEPMRERSSNSSASAGQPAAKASARGSGGRKSVLAALEALLIDRKVPQKQRDAVMAAATENLSKRLAAGETHKVKVDDAAAPSRQPAVVPTPERQRARDRTQAAPAR